MDKGLKYKICNELCNKSKWDLSPTEERETFWDIWILVSGREVRKWILLSRLNMILRPVRLSKHKDGKWGNRHRRYWHYSSHLGLLNKSELKQMLFVTISKTHHCTNESSIRSGGCRQRARGRRSRSLSITPCFSLQSWGTQRLRHSLWDSLDISQSGKCGWIPNENRSSLCFINCCCDRHFQISHIPLTLWQPCRYSGGGKREKC